MRIERTTPKPPPSEIVLTFAESDCWVVVAALIEYADAHPGASHVDQWREWASRLDEELRK